VREIMSDEEEIKKDEEDSGEEDIDAEILADLEDLDQELDGAITETEDDDSEEIIGEAETIPNNHEDNVDVEEEQLPTNESVPHEKSDNLEEDQVSETELEDIKEDTIEEVESAQEDERSKKKNIVEGALFVAGRPISTEELNIKTEIKKKELEELLNELAMDYLMRSTALEIVQIQEKFSLQIKPEYTPSVKKFASGGLIPDKHLKTLTIIALKQPLLKSTLIKIRGSGAYDHVKFLLDRGFIETQKKGRSHEITTTDQFADTFGLSRDIQTLKKQMITQLGINEQKD
jgi:segregation and condensation protein B